MPSVKRPDSLAELFDKLERRVRLLETFPPGAMTLLATSGVQGTPAQPFTTTPTVIPVTATPAFTVQRNTPILIIPTLVFYTSGGTANYGNAWCQVRDSNNGVWGTSAQFIHTNGTALTDTCHPFRVTVGGPGTYIAEILYWLDSGATTTWTASQSNIDVFQLAG